MSERVGRLVKILQETAGIGLNGAILISPALEIATLASGDYDVLAWVDKQLRSVPSGSGILHPVAAYGHKATDAVAGVFFTLAASWFWVSERDRMIDLLTALAPESKRAKARATYLEIDRRLGAYTRLKFLMVFAIGIVLSAGFYAVGLNYWLLVG